MSISKIAKKLRIVASEEVCYIAFKDKNLVRKMLKVPCVTGESPDILKARYLHLVDKFGEITSIMDSNHKDIASYDSGSKPKFYKVTFSTSSSTVLEHVQLVSFDPTDKVGQVIAKAIKLFKEKGLDYKLGNVLSIEDWAGKLVFDPIRDLGKKQFKR